jgi:hypothetical protein
MNWLCCLPWSLWEKPLNRDAWLYVYACLALDCDQPILEALYHSQTLTFQEAIKFVQRVSQNLFLRNGWLPSNGIKFDPFRGVRIERIAFKKRMQRMTVEQQWLADEYRFILSDNDEYSCGSLTIHRESRFHLTKANLHRRLVELIDWNA